MIQNEKIAISIADTEQEIFALEAFIVDLEVDMKVLVENIPQYKLVLAGYIEALNQLNGLNQLIDHTEESLLYTEVIEND